MKTKNVLIILFLFVLVIGSVFYYNEQYKNVVGKTNNNDEVVKPETPVINKCTEGYECIDVDNTTYKFSIKRSIKVNNMFNYDTNENEAGTLKIDNDGMIILNLK